MRKEHQDEVESLQDEISKLKVEHHEYTKKMRDSHEKAFEELRAEHSDVLESMRIDYEESESARRQLQHDIEELNTKLI